MANADNAAKVHLLVMPAWVYPKFKRLAWRHIVGATFTKPAGGWAYVRWTVRRV